MKLAVIPTILASCSAAAAVAVPRSSNDDGPKPLLHEHIVLESPPSTGSHRHRDDAAVTPRHRIPTRYESAVMGRRILALTPLGTLATVFPEKNKHVENSGAAAAAAPLSLFDYIADCEDGGDPTLLAVDIAAHFRNVRAGSNISLALRWAPPYPPKKRIGAAGSEASSRASSPPRSIVDKLLDYLKGRRRDDDDDGGDDGDNGDDGERSDPVPYSAANLPRFSLMGYLEPIPDTEEVRSCFVDAHPDARYWLPGNPIHRAHFARLVVTQVYWVGGFGDRAYIGWIPADEWHSVSRSEWEDISLPGEKEGWEEHLFVSDGGDDEDDAEAVFGGGDL